MVTAGLREPGGLLALSVLGPGLVVVDVVAPVLRSPRSPH